jgi:hypothetical protein
LERRRNLSFQWGYGHYGIFGSLAALGAGLEVAAQATSHRLEASDTLIAFAVAIPVGVFLLLVWALHAPLGATRPGDLPMVLAATAGPLVIAGLVSAGLPLPAAVLLMAAPPSLIVVRAVLTGRSPQASPSSHAPGAASSDAASGPHEPGS